MTFPEVYGIYCMFLSSSALPRSPTVCLSRTATFISGYCLKRVYSYTVAADIANWNQTQLGLLNTKYWQLV